MQFPVVQQEENRPGAAAATASSNPHRPQVREAVSMCERSLWPLIAACGLVIVLDGCGGAERPPMGRVSGKVTYKGQPVTSGSVIFTPVQGTGAAGGRVATGNIQPDGSYALTTFDTGDGAALGQYVVTVEARGQTTMTGPPIDPKTKRPMYVPPKSTIPEKYGSLDKTPLRYTVESGSKTIDLELKD
jgi:hypothetical protein